MPVHPHLSVIKLLVFFVSDQPVPTAAYGLHAKSIVFDRRVAAIGSFNFNLRDGVRSDPRITYLNGRHQIPIHL